MAMSKREMIREILEVYRERGIDPKDDGVPIQELDLPDLIDTFKEFVGYDPEDMAKGGEVKKPKKMKNGGSVEGKRLTRTVPPKKGPNSQGMRGTGIAIRGTKFKGVF